MQLEKYKGIAASFDMGRATSSAEIMSATPAKQGLTKKFYEALSGPQKYLAQVFSSLPTSPTTAIRPQAISSDDSSMMVGHRINLMQKQSNNYRTT